MWVCRCLKSNVLPFSMLLVENVHLRVVQFTLHFLWSLTQNLWNAVWLPRAYAPTVCMRKIILWMAKNLKNIRRVYVRVSWLFANFYGHNTNIVTCAKRQICLLIGTHGNQRSMCWNRSLLVLFCSLSLFWFSCASVGFHI